LLTPLALSSLALLAQGCTRSLKSELVAKGIIRKIPDQPEQIQPSDKCADSVRCTHKNIVAIPRAHLALLQLSSFSRPGSAYTRAQMYPPLARRQSPAIKVGSAALLYLAYQLCVL